MNEADALARGRNKNISPAPLLLRKILLKHLEPEFESMNPVCRFTSLRYTAMGVILNSDVVRAKSLALVLRDWLGWSLTV